MKFLLPFVTALALAIAATNADHACTVAEVESASKNPDLLAAKAKCYSMTTDDSTTTKTDAQNKETCEKNKDCINALTAAAHSIPDCTVDGENMRDAFKKNQKGIIETCQKLGVQVDSAAGSGARQAVATAAIAVAAVVYAHA